MLSGLQRLLPLVAMVQLLLRWLLQRQRLWLLQSPLLQHLLHLLRQWLLQPR